MGEGLVRFGGGCCVVFEVVWGWGRRVGLRKMFVGWSVVGVALIFGQIIGWGITIMRAVSPPFLFGC